MAGMYVLRPPSLGDVPSAARHLAFRTGIPCKKRSSRHPLSVAVLRRPGGPLLDLPASGPGGSPPHSQTRAMYRSIFHWRRLVNGYDSYWPTAFAERMALALRLPEAEALTALRRETGLELLLVHAPDLGGATDGPGSSSRAAAREVCGSSSATATTSCSK